MSSMLDPDDYDCTRCGACCVSDYDAVDYVHLSEDDLARLSPAERRFFIHTDKTYGSAQCSMKTAYDEKDNCRCKALEGVVGESVACSIYEKRPSVCRRFEPGTDVCDYARQAAFGVSDR